MRSPPDPTYPYGDVARVADACSRLDRSISGYNRHSLISEAFRRSLERFQQAQARFEAIRSTIEETQAVITERQASRVRDLAHWREARAAAAVHRAGVEYNVREYVHSLRDEGMPPEEVLIAVKRRLVFAVTDATPDAPVFESSRLATDVGTWTITAYFDAA